MRGFPEPAWGQSSWSAPSWAWGRLISRRPAFDQVNDHLFHRVDVGTWLRWWQILITSWESAWGQSNRSTQSRSGETWNWLTWNTIVIMEKVVFLIHGNSISAGYWSYSSSSWWLVVWCDNRGYGIMFYPMDIRHALANGQYVSTHSWNTTSRF